MKASYCSLVIAQTGAQSSSSPWGFLLGCSLVLLLMGLVLLGIKGLHRIPVGARGVVVTLGRRTGEVRDEGLTWLFPFISSAVNIYTRERQVEVPQTEYYTADRVSISFRTSLRVRVADPAALFGQGPGTYGPFTRDELLVGSRDGEEDHSAVRNLVRNSIRQTVRSLSIQDVMFDGRSGHGLTQRIWDELARTSQRWGLEIVEVWLTEVDARDKDVQKAVQSEVKASMDGRGQLAAHEAQIAKGALFTKVAIDMAEDVHQRLGREIPTEEIVQFLLARYQDDRALDVAMKSAGGNNSLMDLFYTQYLGIPLPQPRMAPGSPRQAAFLASGQGPHSAAADGTWTIGREGDIRLEWDGVSRHHARLETRAGQMTLTDLGSTNGTFVDQQKLPPNVPTAVSPASAVSFGQNVSMKVNELIAATRSH